MRAAKTPRRRPASWSALALRGLGRGREGRLGLLDQAGEGCGIGHGHVGQHLAVELDLGELRSPRPAGAAARDASPSGLPAGGRHLIVYADRLADPGNLGTLVRAAAAFAAAALVASPGSVDLYAPKVVRAGMGAVFALPLYQDVPLARAVDELHAGPVYGLVAHDGRPLDEVAAAIADGPAGDPYAAGGAASTGPAASAGPAILVIGAERAGLSTDALACVTDLVTIPLAGATGGGVESLNAGVAGAIALYELSRPRRPQGARKE